MSRFQVQLSQSQIRSMDFYELEEKLRNSAIEQIDKRDCAGIQKYLEPLFAERELARWAEEKFGVQIDPQEFLASSKGGRNTRNSAADIADLIERKARESYSRREIEYPIDHILTLVMQGRESGAIEDPNAAEYLRAWIYMHFGVELPLPHVQSTPVHRLREELVGYQKQWMTPSNGSVGKIDATADQILKDNPTPELLSAALRQRYGVLLTPEELEKGIQHGKSEAPEEDADQDGRVDKRDTVIRTIRGFLRQELTQLEQFVLIDTLDRSWKDHLYAMDMLRNSIGLQAFAERDPRVLFKKEGYRFFEEMMVGVRDKVTDLIFRARIQGPVQARNAYNITSTDHADAGGYGVAENLQAVGAGVGGGGGEQVAQAEGGEVGGAVTKTIVNEGEKVGRNDPCPCGSGKKYKKCCGQHAA
jgi:preprotein translocase subunit SecA